MRPSRLVITRTIAATLTIASLSLSACTSSSSSVADYVVPADADLVVKAVPSIRWDATEYSATAGEVKIFLANDDNVKHVMVILQDNKVVGDLELVVGKKGSFAEGTINLTAGTYSIYCTIPGHGNMKSVLTVS